MKIDILEKTKLKLSTVSETLCLAKWHHATMHLYCGNTQSCHHVKSHRVPLKEIKKDYKSIHNTNYKKKIRKKMLEGKRVKECDYCWRVEEANQYSDRIHKSSADWSMNYFEETLKVKHKESVAPKYLEIAFDNICNLKCSYCSPSYSSSWLNEIKEHGPYPTSKRYNNLLNEKMNQTLPLNKESRQTYLDAFWSWWPDLVHELEHFRITGGEPLLTKDTWKIFEELNSTKNPNLAFSINSNMSVPLRLIQKLVDQINRLENKINYFILYPSIDTVGKRAEYIRYGLDYSLFLNNVHYVLTNSKWPITISFMISVNALSISYLIELLEVIHKLRKSYPMHIIKFDTPYLNHPRHLSLYILPSYKLNYLDHVIDFMISKKDYPFTDLEVQKIFRIKEAFDTKSLVNTSTYKKDFLRFINEHDKRRKTCFKETFPEYIDWVEELSKSFKIPLYSDK